MKGRIFIVALLLVFVCVPIMAQTNKAQIKEQRELKKQKRKSLDEKSSKTARKEAKKLEKEGWLVIPGKLPLDKQLERSYLMAEEYDDYGYPKFIVGSASSIGENYDAAKLQAMELAKLELAGLMESEIAALTDNTISNEQLSPEQAASIAKSVTASKSKIAQSFGRVITVIEMYRVVSSNKNKEVTVTIAYNHELALEATKKIIRKDLEERGDELHKELDKIVGW